MTPARTLFFTSTLLLFFCGTVFASKKDREAEALIEHAKELSDLHADGAPAFQMRKNFKVRQANGTMVGGAYSEIWVSKAQWRRETAVGDFRRIEIANGRKRWLFDTNALAPDRIEELSHPSIIVMSPRHWKTWKNRNLSGISVHCLKNEISSGSVVCVDKATGTLTSEITLRQPSSRLGERVCSYSDYTKFGERTIAKSFECDEDKQPVLEAKIVELSSLIHQDATLFSPPNGATESVNCLASIEMPKAVFTPEPTPPERFSGAIMVVISVLVGTDGEPHNLKVTSYPRQGFDEAALEGVRNWRFKPASCGGEPIETQVLVQVEFRM